MRIILPLLLFPLLTQTVHAQSFETKASDAFVISRMVERFHVQPRPLDRVMSASIYSRMLLSLDGQRLFFTQADIAKLSPFQYKLDEEILGRKTDFLQLVTRIYESRLTQVDTMLQRMVREPFTFGAEEKLSVAEDSLYPADLPGVRSKIHRLIKWSVANRLADQIADRGGKWDRRFIDSLEPAVRKSELASARRKILRLLQSPTGIGNMIGIVYCHALAECYDPHTSYFSPDEKARFESFLGNKMFAFGFSLTEDEKGHALIGHIEPGSPAFQSGALSEGDRITAIRWEGKDPIDVTDASAEELSRVIGIEGGDRITLDIRKADGTSRQTSLQKQLVYQSTADAEEGRVKGFLLRGDRTIGYISLPDFYEDWENSNGVNGCANDVAKEIIKMKKENIGGLILDLRYNGGGSMQEAVDLAGLFIDAGPVGQIRSRDEKVHTLKDINRGTVWDGPLLVLVNSSSASASEMVAGTLQDYNRALIAGSRTFGKATAQVVLPMDTTIDLSHMDRQPSVSSYLKLTISRLYRINGKTAQFSGVIPDILLPDPPEASARRESDLPFALPPTQIEANKYYHALPQLPVADEQIIATRAMNACDYFKKAALPEPAAPGKPGDISRSLGNLVQERMSSGRPHGAHGTAQVQAQAPATLGADESPGAKNTIFQVANPAYEIQRLQSDPRLKTNNEDRKKEVLDDPYILVAYQLVAGMIK